MRVMVTVVLGAAEPRYAKGLTASGLSMPHVHQGGGGAGARRPEQELQQLVEWSPNKVGVGDCRMRA